MDAIVDSRYGRDRGPLVVLGAFRGFCWVRRTCEVRVVSVRVCAPAISQPPPEIPTKPKFAGSISSMVYWQVSLPWWLQF